MYKIHNYLKYLRKFERFTRYLCELLCSQIGSCTSLDNNSSQAKFLFRLPAAETIRTLAPLREFEILLIICAIIFLALMLLGIGCSYYCLKRRNIKVVKRRPASTLGSEITKISEPISMFDGLKIPRAHAEDTSGSEEMTESVRSEPMTDVISTASEDDLTSCYSDAQFQLPEGAVFAQLHAPPAPGFDVKTKVSYSIFNFFNILGKVRKIFKR